jgi:3-oxoacyl-[acyl-carrier-protein] synthase II
MPSLSTERLVITGWGCVSALGEDATSTWARLIKGEQVRKPVTCFPVEGCRVTEGAEAVIPPISWLSTKKERRLGRASRLALPAAREALEHAGLLDADGRCTLSELEMSISTTAGSMERIEAFVRQIWVPPAARRNTPQSLRVATYQAQQQIKDLQTHLQFSGPSTILSNACAGGANAIGHASDLIRSGMADIVLTGGYDPLCELVFCGFDSLQSLSPDLCRPFDLQRNGLMLGEGAGLLVLESESHAARRGAPVRGILSGYGHSTDTFHLTQPAADGAPLERAMRTALGRAGLSPRDVGYINAHGTATPFNDRAEASAFSRVFGEDPPSLKLSSTKAAVGHTLGAAGGLEAIFCLQSLQTGQIPPQLNTTDPEPLVASILARRGDTLAQKAAMSVNLGFGGSNAALLFTTP